MSFHLFCSPENASVQTLTKESQMAFANRGKRQINTRSACSSAPLLPKHRLKQRCQIRPLGTNVQRQLLAFLEMHCNKQHVERTQEESLIQTTDGLKDEYCMG